MKILMVAVLVTSAVQASTMSVSASVNGGTANSATGNTALMVSSCSLPCTPLITCSYASASAGFGEISLTLSTGLANTVTSGQTTAVGYASLTDTVTFFGGSGLVSVFVVQS